MRLDSPAIRRTQNFLGGLAVLVMPLKLSFSYAALMPLLALWVLQNFSAIPRKLGAQASPLIWPLVVLIMLSAISSVLGFDAWRSLRGLVGLLFLLTAVPALSEVGDRIGFLKLLILLVGGQSIAAYSSVLESCFEAKSLFIGKVSESGQLALTWLLALGLVLELRRRVRRSVATYRLVSFAAANLILFCVLGFAEHFAMRPWLRYTLAGLLVAVIIHGVRRFFRQLEQGEDERCKAYLLFFAAYVLPLISAALLINLKRGPWAGVLVGSLLLLSFNSRKLTALIVGLSLFLSIGVEPIRSRIQQAPLDFFIEGGRATIWNIAADLAARYPVGVGFNNSSHLLHYSSRIPKDNSHFHNNFLNILVETGALGLLVFLWWIYVLLRQALVKYRLAVRSGDEVGSTMPLVLGAAILSWQIAGTVEYNFGDTEVFLVALVVITLLGKAEKLQEELKTF